MFFGSGLGKSLMDGEGAVVKTFVTEAVKAGHVEVQSAVDFKEASKPLCHDENVHEQHLAKKAIRTTMVVEGEEANELPHTRTKYILLQIS